MTRTCGNCLNAYNSPWRTMPQCWNREWLAQFGGTDTTVRPDESCGTWQRRADNQPPVRFPRAVQLELFKTTTD